MTPVEEREEGHAGARPGGIPVLTEEAELRCAESQADGVPCASVVTACAECPRAEAVPAPRGTGERPPRP